MHVYHVHVMVHVYLSEVRTHFPLFSFELVFVAAVESSKVRVFEFRGARRARTRENIILPPQRKM